MSEQGEASELELVTRVTPGQEYIKLTLLRGRVVGAMIIGKETSDLEETMENLIMDGLDVSGIADSLLDPDVDLEDYFD